MQGVHKTIDIKSRRMCSVPQCTGSNLHSFPLERKLREIWKQTLGIRKPLSKYMAVCSKHFLPEDYYYDDTKNYRRLNKGIVPSQNLPVEKVVQFETMNPVLQEAKPIETVMLFSQEDLWASDEYDKLLQGSCRDEEQVMCSDQSPSSRKNELARNNENESTKSNSQLPSGYDKLLVVKYEEEIKPKKRNSPRNNEEFTKRNLQLPSGYDKLLVVKYEKEIKPKKRNCGRTKTKVYKPENVKSENKRLLLSCSAEKKRFDKYGEFQTRNGHSARRGRPVGTKTKIYKGEDVKTENKRSLRYCSAEKKRFDKYEEFQTRNGHSARRGRPVGSKNGKLKKVQISDDYYDLLDASSAYKEQFKTNTKPSRINNKPHWYVEFVDKGTQTDSNKEKLSMECKYQNRSTQTTRYVEYS